MDENIQRSGAGTPAAEVRIDAELAAGLLCEQFPDIAGLPIAPAASGWDNAMYRLGDELAVRLPRRAASAALVEHEQTWLPSIASRLSLPVPSPVRCGRPGLGYPWRWSVVPWLPGETADARGLGREQAAVLAGFMNSLHTPAPAGAPRNPFRGVPLRTRAALVEARLLRLGARTELVTPAIYGIWRQALEAPADAGTTWIHGDPHPCNFLMENGKITGVIDWGDMAAGDPATDLAAIWLVLDDKVSREDARSLCEGADAHTWARAKGWAVLLGSVLLESGLADDPKYARIGERTFLRLAEDAKGPV